MAVTGLGVGQRVEALLKALRSPAPLAHAASLIMIRLPPCQATLLSQPTQARLVHASWAGCLTKGARLWQVVKEGSDGGHALKAVEFCEFATREEELADPLGAAAKRHEKENRRKIRKSASHPEVDSLDSARSLFCSGSPDEDPAAVMSERSLLPLAVEVHSKSSLLSVEGSEHVKVVVREVPGVGAEESLEPYEISLRDLRMFIPPRVPGRQE